MILNGFYPDFQKGDIIEFCEEQFEVLENWGTSGKVREYPNTQENNLGFQTVISSFYWEYQETRCKLVKKAE